MTFSLIEFFLIHCCCSDKIHSISSLLSISVPLISMKQSCSFRIMAEVHSRTVRYQQIRYFREHATGLLSKNTGQLPGSHWHPQHENGGRTPFHSSKNFQIKIILVPGFIELLIETYIVSCFSELSKDACLTEQIFLKEGISENDRVVKLMAISRGEQNQIHI